MDNEDKIKLTKPMPGTETTRIHHPPVPANAPPPLPGSQGSSGTLPPAMPATPKTTVTVHLGGGLTPVNEQAAAAVAAAGAALPAQPSMTSAPTRAAAPAAVSPSERQTRIMLLGAPASGKTALLAAMRYAVLQEQMDESGGYCCKVDDETQEFKDICRSFRSTIETGRFSPNSTTRYTLHGMTLKLEFPQQKGWLGKMKKVREDAVFRIEVPDYPGGATAGAKAASSDAPVLHRDARDEIIRRLPQATGLIICLPEDGRAGVESSRFLVDINNLIDDLPSNAQLAYVAFALTKIDAHKQSMGRGVPPMELFTTGRHAWTKVCEASYEGWLENRLRAHGVTQEFIGNLRRKCGNRAIRFAAGRTSIFGFVQSQGCFNYDPDFQGLLIRHKDEGDEELYPPHRVAEEWRPFQVIDPFLFACDGVLPTYPGQPGRGFQPVFE